MTPQDQIREFAEEKANELDQLFRQRHSMREVKFIVKDAILEGVKLALAEPSQDELRKIACKANVWPVIHTVPDAIIEAVRIYLNAAFVARRRELGVEQ